MEAPAPMFQADDRSRISTSNGLPASPISAATPLVDWINNTRLAIANARASGRLGAKAARSRSKGRCSSPIGANTEKSTSCVARGSPHRCTASPPMMHDRIPAADSTDCTSTAASISAGSVMPYRGYAGARTHAAATRSPRHRHQRHLAATGRASPETAASNRLLSLPAAAPSVRHPESARRPSSGPPTGASRPSPRQSGRATVTAARSHSCAQSTVVGRHQPEFLGSLTTPIDGAWPRGPTRPRRAHAGRPEYRRRPSPARRAPWSPRDLRERSQAP